MRDYQHTIQYYETDQMAIVHHANYIRWMEEARVDFLSQMGYGLETWEEKGIVSPVLGLDCRYKAATTFPQVISIRVRVVSCGGAKIRLGYTMRNPAGQVVFTATSDHCFQEKTGRIVRLRREFPAFYQALMENIGAEERGE